jgi:sec-independent protein translocase protein TatC
MAEEKEKEMSFLEHLEELRWHLIRSLIAIVVLMVVAFIYTSWIFDHIVFAPARADFITFQYLCEFGKWTGAEEALCVKELPFKIQSRYMTGQFTMQITSAFIMGLIVAFPYVFWEIWRFVRPGLYSKEKLVARGAVAAVSGLFLTGVLFGYFIMCPLSVWFLSTYSISDMIVNEFDITSYVSTMSMLILGGGMVFQLPVVMYFLTRVGVVTPAFLRKYRKHAIILILVVGAIITPPDPLSQMLISAPLYLLYEVSIFISAMVMRKKEQEEKAAQAG